MRNRRQKGNAIIEFTLVGIPLIFILISIFEAARGFWIYHTLAYAMKEASRFVIVKGENCVQTPNACGVTVAQIAAVIKDRGVGLIPSDLNVTLSSLSDTRSCTLQACLSDNTPWPTLAVPSLPGGARGQNLTITGRYPFRSAIAMFWPGSAPMIFGTFTFGANSREQIQF